MTTGRPITSFSAKAEPFCPGKGFLILFAACLLTACNRSDNADQGGTPSGTQGTFGESRQTDNPVSAPDAQPQYGKGGTSTTSRIVTSPGNQTGPTSTDRGQSPSSITPGTLSDEELAKKVHVALSTGTTGTTGTYAPDILIQEIQVSAANGVVTLTGEVGSQAAKRMLEERARAVQGVKEVTSKITVSPDRPDKGPMPGAPAGRGQTDVIPQSSERDIRR